jgi:O-antigen ligase
MTPEYVTELGVGEVGFLYGRGGGLFGNPDFVGAFLVVPLVLAAGLLISGRSARERAVAGATGALIMAAMVVTQVRAGWVGALVGLLVMGIALLGAASAQLRRRIWLVAVGLGIALAVGAAITGPALLAERFSVGAEGGLDAISSGRISGWRDALTVIGDRPLLGTGPDSFTLGWYGQTAALADPLTGARSYFEDPHNVYLAIAATMGIPAALALLALFGMALRSGIENLKATVGHPETRGVYAAWLAAMSGLLVTSLFAVTTIPTVLMLFVCAAVMLSPGARSHDLSAGAAVSARAIAALIAVVLLVVGTLPIRADYHLGQHMRTGSIDSLNRARAIAPWEKTIQLRYLAVTRAALVPLLQAGTADAYTAVEKWDAETYRLIDAHPHELLYTLERLDLLGQAAGMLGPAIGEKNLVVANLAVVEYPKLQDLAVYKARALNKLDRYAEAVDVLEPMPASVTRDAALAESYLLNGEEAAARELVRAIAENYAGSAYAEAFLSQPTIKPLLTE